MRLNVFDNSRGTVTLFFQRLPDSYSDGSEKRGTPARRVHKYGTLEVCTISFDVIDQPRRQMRWRKKHSAFLPLFIADPNCVRRRKPKCGVQKVLTRQPFGQRNNAGIRD